MTKTRKLTAILPSGEIVTRRTARTYTHVVARKVTYADGTTTGWSEMGWCGRPDLAEKQVAKLCSGWVAGAEVGVSWTAEGGWVAKTLAKVEVQAVPVEA